MLTHVALGLLVAFLLVAGLACLPPLLTATAVFFVLSPLLFLLLAPPGVAAERWAPPVQGGPTRLFTVGPDPFARGQHRGVDFAASGPVRAACAGRVVFAGRVAGAGTVSERCGRWRVSYAPLTRVAVRAGHAVGPGTRLGHASGPLHLGVRREGARFGYVDPLRFLADRRPPPPLLIPPALTPPVRRPPPIAARPHAPPALAPWPVWLGLTLLLTGLLGAGKLRPPSRRQEEAPCRASSTSSCSPTIPSSPRSSSATSSGGRTRAGRARPTGS